MQSAAAQAAAQHPVEAAILAEISLRESDAIFGAGDLLTQKIQPFRSAAWRHRPAP
ncbi:hypothetical protein MPC4_30115 [Methylocella tundrae]|uniref:Uncharacterized protein n=1 Tax=Methylocella tundrae TaxID=227605 RepID=A0A4U8YZV0_METTU|nr:protein of unknown function [Methylocella tundrae]VTZ50931.1 hypothetical protein MPC4_30115 [Methylocella tundrae]